MDIAAKLAHIIDLIDAQSDHSSMDFKKGLLPNDPSRPRLKLGDILRTTEVAIPASEDYIQAVQNWDVLGNDKYSDCVPVGVANAVYALTSLLGMAPSYPTLDACLAFYKSQNPGFPQQDDGMIIQQALEFLRTDGIEVGKDASGKPIMKKALAFAQVDVSNEAEVKAALAVFGVGLFGVDVLAVNNDQFDHGQPWDYDANSADDGGHCVLGGGENLTGVRIVTWGTETGFTEAFIKHQVQEFWVVIFAEHLLTKQFIQGIDQASLASEFKALTGGDFPQEPAPVEPSTPVVVAPATPSPTVPTTPVVVVPINPQPVDPATPATPVEVNPNLDVDVALADASHLYLAAQEVLAETRQKYLAAQQNWFNARGL